jgi:hypothetical protein
MLTPIVNAIKLFVIVTDALAGKAKVLVPGKPSKSSLIFAITAKTISELGKR